MPPPDLTYGQAISRDCEAKKPELAVYLLEIFIFIEALLLEMTVQNYSLI